ncbi:hypothetical protein Tco_1534844 [Tanacetum coccineum]
MVELLGAIPINLKGNMWDPEELIEKRIDWNMPPKEGDGACHIRIELIDPNGEKFKKAFQSIPTTREGSSYEVLMLKAIKRRLKFRRLILKDTLEWELLEEEISLSQNPKTKIDDYPFRGRLLALDLRQSLAG